MLIPGLEPGFLDSKSRVITTTLYEHGFELFVKTSLKHKPPKANDKHEKHLFDKQHFFMSCFFTVSICSPPFLCFYLNHSKTLTYTLLGLHQVTHKARMVKGVEYCIQKKRPRIETEIVADEDEVRTRSSSCHQQGVLIKKKARRRNRLWTSNLRLGYRS
jgi:hypothetical protein